MRHKKVSDIELKELVKDVFEKKMFRREVMDKYNISQRTFVKNLNRAAELGYITEKQRLEWAVKSAGRGFEARSKLRGLEESIEISRKGWRGGLGKSQRRLKKAGYLGGMKLHEKYPLHRRNVDASYYCPHAYYYNRIKYASQGERFLALLLLEYGLFEKIISGENFNKKFGKRKADFFLNSRNTGLDRDIVLEFHQIPRKHPQIKLTKHSYTMKRKAELKKGGFNGQVIVLIKVSEFYNILPKLGIEKDWSKYLDKFNKVKQKTGYRG